MIQIDLKHGFSINVLFCGSGFLNVTLLYSGLITPMAIAMAMGAETGACARGLQSFEGLAHRMAFVAEHEGVAYYNDSKATNVASVLAGLRGFERRFVLIAGGQLKGEPLAELIDLVRSEGIALVAMGRDRELLVEAAGEAIARARAGEGPTLLECKTYRYFDHVGVRGMGLSYRTDEEVEEWRKKDPIDQFEARLAEQGVLSTADAQAVHDEVMADIDAAIKFAEESPYPDADAILEDVYA